MAAQCAYCGADLRPHTMFCLGCGQLAAAAPTPATRQGPTYSGAAAPPAMAPSQVPLPPVPTTRPAQPVAPATQASAAQTSAVQPSAAQAPAIQTSAVQAPVPPQMQPAPPAVSVPAPREVDWMLAVGDRELEVSVTTYVGRRPDVPEGAQGHAVDDPARTVSRNHAVFYPAARALEVEDLGSSNGTHLERGGAVVTCVPGVRVALSPGDVVMLGDLRVEIRAYAAR